MVRAALALLLTIVPATGCGHRAHGPKETVDLYFETLGRDPARNLSLLSDEFHDRHGLSVPLLEGWSWGIYDDLEPVEPDPDDPFVAVSRQERGIESAKTAWLMVQGEAEFQQVVRGLQFVVTDELADEVEAVVRVRVRPASAPLPFHQDFRLARATPDADWQIVQIEQYGVARLHGSAAYVAYPTEIARRALAEQRRSAAADAASPRE